MQPTILHWCHHECECEQEDWYDNQAYAGEALPQNPKLSDFRLKPLDFDCRKASGISR